MFNRAVALFVVYSGSLLLAGSALANEDSPSPAPAEKPVKAPQPMKPALQAPTTVSTADNPMHPPFSFLDAEGKPVFGTDAKPAAATTCGACHDVKFIHRNSSHPVHKFPNDCFTCHEVGDLKNPRPEHYDDQGRFIAPMGEPNNRTCGKCHGLVTDRSSYLELTNDFLAGKLKGPFGTTLRTGEVFSPQHVSESFLNLTHKAHRQWPWDVHAARRLTCTSCHFAGNNPSRLVLIRNSPLEHLQHDPRSLSIGAYLKRPDHRLKAADCRTCHDPSQTHKSLPYAERHLSALACQTCHVSQLSMPVPRSVDRTVVTPENGPCMQLRGVKQRQWRAPNTWYTEGYRPFLLEEVYRGTRRLAPYNLVAEWYWGSKKQGKRVADDIVQRAWRQADGSVVPALVPLFDTDGDGKLAATELRIDSDAKTAAIRKRLEMFGVHDPHIVGSVVAYPVRHGVMAGEQAKSGAACDNCHGSQSRFSETILLSNGPFPGGVVPTVDPKTKALLGGRNLVVAQGRLQIVGDQQAVQRYILGHSRKPWTDRLGFVLLVLTVLGVAGHGTLRYRAYRRLLGRSAPAVPMKRVYMYGMYERFWHWTMAVGVIVLLVSGMQIHFVDQLGLMKLPTAVFIHNIMAFVVIANAFLSLFFHVATGEIRQFVPKPAGLLRRLTQQASYYTRGIFSGMVHPFHKAPHQKLNPLQQITYLGLLNVLFPVQVITGILLWYLGHKPNALTWIGGLSVVGPIHNLTSWLFMSFTVMHVYLTTTGHTPLANLRAMVDGWDEIEVAAGEDVASQEHAHANQ